MAWLGELLAALILAVLLALSGVEVEPPVTFAVFASGEVRPMWCTPYVID